VRLELSKNLAKDVVRRTPVMTDVVVKSNYARSRTILLDGRYPLSFDAEGRARIPAHLRESFEREMAAKPGRYSFDAPPVVYVSQDVAPKVVELAAKPETKEALVDSELSDEQPKKAVPAVAVKSKKK
jgi:hypothetical protein